MPRCSCPAVVVARRFGMQIAASHKIAGKQKIVTKANGKTSIQVIERMMDLLDAPARSEQPMNLKRLANSTSLHPSTVHRILNMMVEFRMVGRIEPGTYRLGIRLLEH